MRLSNTYPWPPTVLWPNDRSHWRKKNPVKRQFREVCYSLTEKVEIPQALKEQHFAIEYYFYPPNKRRYDCDNVVNGCKALVDGMCRKLEIDDYFIDRGRWQRMEKFTGGKVVIVLDWRIDEIV